MAEKTMRVCDVMGTIKDVQAVHVTVQTGNGPVLRFDPKDMGPAARKRLEKMIGRGMTPPTKRGDTE